MGLVWRMCPSLGLKDGKEEAINPNSKAPFQAHPPPPPCRNSYSLFLFLTVRHLSYFVTVFRKICLSERQ